MKKNILLLMMIAFVASLAFAPSTNAQIIFSNDFEDGDFNPEVGSWTFGASATTSVVGTAVAGDPTLGDNVGLFDTTGALDLSLDLASTALLANGGTVNLDFDFAARRTFGNPRTVFFDALDSSGNIVTRFVMGDANAFGNGGGDRQRPGFDIDSSGDPNTGNSTFGGTPGSFWWGADTSPTSFDVGRDAHLSFSIGASSFDFATTSQNGTTFSASGIANYNGGTFADIASFSVTSVGNAGFYIDNLTVVAKPVPEPSSFVLGLSVLGFCVSRRRRRMS